LGGESKRGKGHQQPLKKASTQAFLLLEIKEHSMCWLRTSRRKLAARERKKIAKKKNRKKNSKSSYNTGNKEKKRPTF